MKHSQILIKDYKYNLESIRVSFEDCDLDKEFISFFLNENFDISNVFNELTNIEDLQDKILFLKFLIDEMSYDIDMIKYKKENFKNELINYKTEIKKLVTTDNKVKEEMLKSYKSDKKEDIKLLNDSIKTIETYKKELINEFDILTKIGNVPKINKQIENKSFNETFNYNFDKVKNYGYEFFQNINDRINYFERVKTIYLQNKITTNFDFDTFPIEVTSFDTKIELEIMYLLKLKKLKKDNTIPEESKAGLENTKIKKSDKKMTDSKNTKAKYRIEWLLGDTDLIEFFEILKNENIISKTTFDNFKVIARDCFIRKNGSDFDNQSLARLEQQKGESKKAHKIKTAIQTLKKKKNNT